uniref:Macaca fascicularis brain cDNA clone: QflA-18552, similar to human homer homolog 1 (Drosophila) (HOMER1), mRNA, RefSeq: NM_004272.3 n=1 Tax=Macaca fascicularis TaxID=9541 RepID=I7GIB1_MACFA|nr:unnamed protein product [Macaca fascicularis]
MYSIWDKVDTSAHIYKIFLRLLTIHLQ